MTAVRYNALDQALDVAGSLFQSGSYTVSDEALQLGPPVGNTGTASATLTGPDGSGQMTVTGLTGATFTLNSQGNFVVFTGFTNGVNNGTFLITVFLSATSVKFLNASGIAEGPTPGVTWNERYPYRLEDDMNYERSDRAAIKGVAFSAAVPTYQQASNVGTNIPANLSNIAGKTLDAFARTVNRGQFKWAVEATLTDIYGSGTLKHADAVNTTGVPCFDAAPFVGDWNSSYVWVTGATSGVQLFVLAGGHAGETIFGITKNGTSTSPNSVEIDWYSAPAGANIATSATAYTWEKGATPTSNTGTTSVTVVAGANGSSAITGLTGGNFLTGDVGNWVTFSGLTNAGNNGSFVIISVQSTTAITVQNHAAVSEGPTAAVTWTEYPATQVTFVDLTYGYNERLDQLDQNAFRVPMVTGLVSDANLSLEIKDLEQTVGVASFSTSLATYLTNTGPNYAFNDLGTATPSVVTALNTLNAQIGIRTYTGPYLTSGQTITASLQALSNAIAASSITRYIERLAADVPANTSHTLPGGATYVLDGTNNGRGLAVFARGLLNDPGLVINGDNYSETSTTAITFFSKQKSGDHINYWVL